MIDELKRLREAASKDDLCPIKGPNTDTVIFQCFAYNNMPEIISRLEQAERMREALTELEVAVTAILEAVDNYNEENKTFLCGGTLFHLAKATGNARAAINQAGMTKPV